MSVSMKDNSSAVQGALQKAEKEALLNMGALVKAAAQELCPVRTGNLRDSIDYQLEGSSVCIGSDTYYASYVELGTSSRDARPFLKPAAIDNTDKLVAVASAEYYKALQG